MSVGARAALLAGVLLSAGCAHYVWYRPDATAEILARDHGQCEDEARNVARDYDVSGLRDFSWPWAWRRPFMPVPTPFELEQDVLQRCMESRGYRLQKQASQRG